MKKLFILSAMLIAGLVSSYAAVDYSARAFIKMNGNELRLRESADFNAGYTQGACVSDNNNIGMAALVNGTRYIQWGCNDLEGLQLSVVPGESNILTISNVIGDLYLVDAEDGSRTKLENGEITLNVSGTDAIVGRFSISKIGALVPQICHEGQELKVSNATQDVLVDGEIAVITEGKIDISNLAAGHHTVTFEGVEMIILVQ